MAFSEYPNFIREKLDSPKASSDTRHGQRNKMVQISICRGGQFQGTETNVIESFVVNAESFVSVFYQLVNGECSIIRLDHGVTDLIRQKIKKFLKSFKSNVDLISTLFKISFYPLS